MAVCTACGQENPDGFRLCGMCGAPLAVAAERRKLATIVFCDMVGSTALAERLDAEAVRELRSRYFDEMRAALEAHGGRVEKYIGDAVMAVFGVPVAHEDDALRAVRAAAEMLDRLAALNGELERRFGTRIDIHVGVDTGEVVTGDGARGEPVATGDTVNVAARLEGAAGAGEVVVGAATRRLAGAAASFEPIEPLALKGKSQPVPAFRLVDVERRPAARVSRGSALVGRSRELALLQEEVDRAEAERTTRLRAVLGEPGVGKSRLAAELTGAVEGRAQVLVGRCLSYGQGITYWPLAEIVRRAAGIAETDTAAERRERIVGLVAGEDRAEALAAVLAAVAGVGDAATTPGEIAWAARTLLHALARERPLLLVLDDLHWAEPGFLELVDSLLDRGDAPIAVVVLARPELAETRPGWPALRLEPLPQDETAGLVATLAAGAGLDAAAARRAVEASGGNPLFAEELVAMLAEDPELEIPPRVEALLGARLDRLPDAERAAAERGAVEGQTFHRGAVAALSAAEARPRVTAALVGLVARQLAAEARAGFANELAYRFRHILIRDAAYRAIPKRLRSELHERFAAWLEEAAADRPGEVEELLGYHLEQAHRCRLEVGAADEASAALGRRAAERLAAAARRADTHGDAAAAANLFSRALALLPEGDALREPLLPELARVLFDGGELEGAARAVAEATLGEDETVRARALLVALALEMQRDPSAPVDAFLRSAESVVAVLAGAGDEVGVARALIQIALIRHMSLAQSAEARVALERALPHAERAGALRELNLIRGRLCNTATRGPVPAGEAIELCERTLGEAGDAVDLEARARENLGWLYAMTGRFDEGRTMFGRARELRRELGQQLFACAAGQGLAFLELTAGDAAAAETVLRETAAGLERLGAMGFLTTIDAMLASALYDQGKLAEADAAASRAEGGAAEDDLFSQFLARLTRARLLARAGRSGEAERVAGEAIAIADATDFLDWQADARLAQADVLALLGREQDAAEARNAAVELYERKGCSAMARRLSGRHGEADREGGAP